MKLMRNGTFWFTVLLGVIVLGFVLFSFNYKAEPRFIPLLVGIPTLIMIILVLLSERYPKLISLFNVSLGDVESVLKRKPAQSETDLGRKVLAILAWMAGFILLIFLVGFIIAVPIFVFLFLKIYTRAGWLTAVIISLIMVGLIYGGFEVLMRANMFEGLLFGAQPSQL
ncbi:tripartite tricarboxylate transporter TctB family protein [Chloroflexota bacterium]